MARTHKDPRDPREGWNEWDHRIVRALAVVERGTEGGCYIATVLILMYLWAHMLGWLPPEYLPVPLDSGLPVNPIDPGENP